METAIATKTTKISTIPKFDIAKISEKKQKELTDAFIAFLDTGGTAMGRGTYYNTKSEQDEAVHKIHKNLHDADRGIYELSLLLSGLTDYTKLVGAYNLLSITEGKKSIFPLEREGELIKFLSGQVQPNRVLKLFLNLKKNKVNNARTRKLILRTILARPSLELWAVKYRKKLRQALEHAWGKRTTSIIASILAKGTGKANGEVSRSINTKESLILTNKVSKYCIDYNDAIGNNDKVLECVSFILGNEDDLTLPLLRAYHESKLKLEKGKKLPKEVLEGIRSRYHKDTPKEKILELTKDSMTGKQSMQVQKKAKEAGVKIDFDPMKQKAVDLYIYAFEMGWSDKIEKALLKKAKQSAEKIPMKYENIGILVDCSESMYGHTTQKLRPISVALATRDMLMELCKEKATAYCGGIIYGSDPILNSRLYKPSGDTNLAKGLVSLIKRNPDMEAMFIITDGYENTQSGRVNEVIGALKNIGINIPVYQISPVMAAESKGVKLLSKDIPVIPINQPEGITLGLVKAAFMNNIEQGIKGLLQVTIPLLEAKN